MFCCEGHYFEVDVREWHKLMHKQIHNLMFSIIIFLLRIPPLYAEVSIKDLLEASIIWQVVDDDDDIRKDI